MNVLTERCGMGFNNSVSRCFFLHFEWIVLLAALLLMVLINPYADAESFCLLSKAGFSYCPGTGFGNSVALLARGDVVASFTSHPAGIPAVFILIHRIYSIFKRNLHITKEALHG